MKTCTKCGELKALDAFHFRLGAGDGRRAMCRNCVNTAKDPVYQARRNAAYREANRDALRAYDRAKYQGKANEAKVYAAAYRASNSEKVKALGAAYYRANAETLIAKQKQRDSARQPEIAERKKRYRQTNRGRINALNRKREYAQIKRTPPWADLDAIKEIYEKAARIAELTGEPVHVDHDIPLRGKRVSGLHVANNLVICHATGNLRKSNRFEVA